MNALPLEPLEPETAAAAIYGSQARIKDLCDQRDALTKAIAAEYRAIEDAGYTLRILLAQAGTPSARIGGYEVAAKYDLGKKPKVARVLVGATGEVKILPGNCPTSRLVVRKAKP